MGVWIYGANSLTNGDFETGDLTGWSLDGSTASLEINGDAYGGSWCGRVRKTTGLSDIALYQRGFSVVAGQQYFFRCAIKNTESTIGSMTLKITNYAMDADWAAGETITVVKSWQIYGYGFESSTTGSAAIRLEIPGTLMPAGSAQKAFFDDLTLAAAAEINAGYDYKFGQFQRRNDIRDRDGGLHNYILPGGYRQFDFPSVDIGSAGRCSINSFWANNDTCYLIDNNTNPQSMYAVKIMEIQEAFQSRVKPFGLTRYVGDLKLETVDVE